VTSSATGSDRTLTPALRDATIRWIADDPSPDDRAELQRVLANAMAGVPDAVADLKDRMRAPLTFGTAGLRGPLRAGPAGMNLAVVRRAAAGIADHLIAGGSRGRQVVVGFDARHRSAEFAADVAGVLAAAGFSVLLAPGPLPTPITAFAVRHLGAVAGLQVTASHNPPQDNGLKVYLDQGAQLVGPEDVRIERAIAATRPARRDRAPQLRHRERPQHPRGEEARGRRRRPAPDRYAGGIRAAHPDGDRALDESDPGGGDKT